MDKKNQIIAIVEVQADGYSAYLDIPNHAITSAGESLFELKENIQEALDLFLETAKEMDIDITQIEGKEVELQLDVKELFSYFKAINLSGFAAYTGINRSLLNQYATGIKKPSEKQSIKILKGLKKLGRELLSVHAI